MMSSISSLCARMAVLENIILAEFGAQRVVHGHLILDKLKANYQNLISSEHEQIPVGIGIGNDSDVTDPDNVELDKDRDDDEQYGGEDEMHDDYMPVVVAVLGSESEDNSVTEKDDVLVQRNEQDPLTTRSGLKRRVPPKVKLGLRLRKKKKLDKTDRTSTKRTKSRSELPHMCEECGKTLSSRKSLRLHQTTHNRDNKHQCSQCPASFPTAFDRDQHAKNHELNRPWSCELCSARFKCRQNLLAHHRVHDDDKSFTCTECNRSYKHKGGYNRHILSAHSKIRPYSCTVCSKKFALAGHVQDHVRRVHKIFDKISIPKDETADDVKPKRKNLDPEEIKKKRQSCGRVVCDLCGASILESGYRKHYRTHVVNFRCEICEKGFSTEHALRFHETLAHDPARTLPCTFPGCDEKFKQTKTLRVHERKHQSKLHARFACKECGLKYKHKSGLNQHVNATHTHDKLFPCSECLKIFHSTTKLKKHLLGAHKLDSSPSSPPLRTDVLENEGDGLSLNTEDDGRESPAESNLEVEVIIHETTNDSNGEQFEVIDMSM